MPILPSAVTRQAEIHAAISTTIRQLAPHVIQIRYEVGEDWSGEGAIFFRILLSDEASRTQLAEITSQVVWKLASLLDFDSLGVRPYHNFRSASEQAELREPAWA